jgi:hypothetical protein
LAFLTNHFFLKALHLTLYAEEFLALVPAFLAAYRSTLGDERSNSVEASAARLLPMLLLARVDGKSPVEYLAGQTAKQQIIREFSLRAIPTGTVTYADLIADWNQTLKRL